MLLHDELVMNDTPNITQPFYVDPAQRGVVRGGWMDELGGILVGVHAEWVCRALNDAAPTPMEPR